MGDLLVSEHRKKERKKIKDFVKLTMLISAVLVFMFVGLYVGDTLQAESARNSYANLISKGYEPAQYTISEKYVDVYGRMYSRDEAYFFSIDLGNGDTAVEVSKNVYDRYIPGDSVTGILVGKTFVLNPET